MYGLIELGRVDQFARRLSISSCDNIDMDTPARFHALPLSPNSSTWGNAHTVTNGDQHTHRTEREREREREREKNSSRIQRRIL
jgi:hypothetical protein